ncbi:MAG: hypothetical protein LBD11_02860 [Candidatus Peribacteria bacterium]|jgi:calcineurin-like phosphoesterase family protein|nr:hypothetical protein [Candidatus Peribacteria bacterium]
MQKKFFTSDWHTGEVPENVPYFPATHSYLRPQRTDVLISQWIQTCHEKVDSSDTLYFLGDMAIQLTDLEVYKDLPACHKVLVMGDKEYASKHFREEQFLEEIKKLDIFNEIIKNGEVRVGEVDWFMSHKPTDCLLQEKPALCGHVHGIWRTQAMKNGQPIINVGVDAWFGLVSEDFVIHQYNAITKGYYDRDARIDLW